MRNIFYALAILLSLTASVSAEQLSSKVYLYDLEQGLTGSEVCYREKMSCLSVTTAKLHDNEGKFYGFVTPSCDSQVIEKDACKADFDTDYAIDNVIFKKSPRAKSDQLFSADYFCLSSDKGKKGKYAYVYCVKR